MKNILSILLIAFTYSISCFGSDEIIVDSKSVRLFDSIPSDYKQAAANLRMFFMDRSVGGNISDGLDCLSSPWEDAPSHCKRWEHKGEPPFNVDESEVHWDGVWDRSNWTYEFWQSGCQIWYGAVDCFIEKVEARLNELDVFGFQLSYLAVDENSNIADPVDGFFGNKDDRGTASKVIEYAVAHPDKTVIWWTTSLARSIGTQAAQDFNNQMRQFVKDNGYMLFDVADILSHTPDGAPCCDNRDGEEYAFGKNSENHPDDGLNLPAICPEYTTEVEGGHLGSVSAGKIMVAKAFRVLMAQIAGWDPDGPSVVSENPEAKKSITILPNPAAEYIEVNIPFSLHFSGKYEVEITNTLGRSLIIPLFFYKNQRNVKIDLSDLAEGMYVLRIRAGGEFYVQRFVVLR